MPTRKKPAEAAASPSPKPRKPRLSRTSAPAVDAAPPVAAAPAPARPAPDRAAIAARAYAIYQAEGGSALDNWLRAERELSG